MKVLVKISWGPDDPTRAAFPFLHANALAETGHEVQIFLLRTPVANASVLFGCPPARRNIGADHLDWNTDPRLRGVLAGA